MTTSVKYFCNVVLTILIISISYFTNAQSNTVSAGNNFSSLNGSVSFTVGQIFYEHPTNGSTTITQGVQQPYEIETTSVGELASKYEFKVFPNPMNNELNIFCNVNDISVFSIQITDMNGKTVYETNSLMSNKIDVSFFLPGSYFLTFKTNSESIAKYKLIKQ